MKIKEFSADSPLGLGWVTGHVALGDAITALAKASGDTRDSVIKKYEIELELIKEAGDQ